MENNNLHTDKESCIKEGCICITARKKTTYYKTIKVKNI